MISCLLFSLTSLVHTSVDSFGMHHAPCVAAPLAGLGVWQDTNGRLGKGVASFAFALVSRLRWFRVRVPTRVSARGPLARYDSYAQICIPKLVLTLICIPLCKPMHLLRLALQCLHWPSIAVGILYIVMYVIHYTFTWPEHSTVSWSDSNMTHVQRLHIPSYHYIRVIKMVDNTDK